MLGQYAVYAHVGAEHLGNAYSAILALIVLNDRDPGAANGQARAVEGVHEFRFCRP